MSMISSKNVLSALLLAAVVTVQLAAWSRPVAAEPAVSMAVLEEEVVRCAMNATSGGSSSRQHCLFVY